MTVEHDVLRRKLLEINEVTRHLRSWTPVSSEQLETNQQLRWAVEGGCKSQPRRSSARLKGPAGFRNVLVHEYADVDLKRVHAGLQRLGDFDMFVADVERWLQARTPAASENALGWVREDVEVARDGIEPPTPRFSVADLAGQMTQQGPNGTESRRCRGPCCGVWGHPHPGEHGQKTDSSFLASIDLRTSIRTARLIGNQLHAPKLRRTRRFSGTVRELSVSLQGAARTSGDAPAHADAVSATDVPQVLTARRWVPARA